MILTIFKNLETDDRYNGLNNYPKFVLKLNSLLLKAGIKQVINKYDSVPDEDLFSDDITMLIRAYPQEFTRDVIYHREVRNYLSDGFSSVPDYYYTPSCESTAIKIKIETNGHDHTITTGHYFPSRNMILISLPLFYYDWERGIDKPLDLVTKIIESLKKLKIKKVDISKEIERVKIEKFMRNAKSEIGTLRSDIDNAEKNARQYGVKLIEETKKSQSYFVRIQALENLLKTNFNILAKRIKEIKSLAFVKRVNFTRFGISVHIGIVSLAHKGKKHTLGRYRIYVNPSEIKIYNLDAIRKDSEWYDHPHVKDEKPCLGGWSLKMYEMLSKLDLKNLVVYIKLFLQTYNEQSPHMKMTSWIGFRKNQKLALKDPVPEEGSERYYTKKLRDEQAGVNKEETQENHQDIHDTGTWSISAENV